MLKEKHIISGGNSVDRALLYCAFAVDTHQEGTYIFRNDNIYMNIIAQKCRHTSNLCHTFRIVSFIMINIHTLGVGGSVWLFARSANARRLNLGVGVQRRVFVWPQFNIISSDRGRVDDKNSERCIHIAVFDRD